MRRCFMSSLHARRCDRSILDPLRAGNCHFLCPPRLEMNEPSIRRHVHLVAEGIRRVTQCVAGSPFPGIPTDFVGVACFEDGLVVDFAAGAADAGAFGLTARVAAIFGKLADD